MKPGTIKILLLFLCLAATTGLNAQIVDAPVIPQVTSPVTDTLAVTQHAPRQIKAAPVPGINGPQDIKLDREESLKFLERFSSSPAIWKKSNDPLREAIRNLLWLASRPPADTVISFLSDYPFDRIKVPAESYYLFDSIRIILPVI